MTHRIRALFDGRVFIPLEPVNLPPGTVLEIAIYGVDDEQIERNTSSDEVDLAAGHAQNESE